MSPRPEPTTIVHFTHVRNLPGMVQHGLRSDAVCRGQGLTQVEVGDLDIRERRLTLPVGTGPGGFVGDYVPFYFGPRSPMMFRLRKTDEHFLAEYDEIVYLVTTIEAVEGAGRTWVASDRNAALAVADFVCTTAELDSHIDWDLIAAKYWGDYPDGKERRMAELLVHGSLPWGCVEEIVVRSEATRRSVSGLLAGAGHAPPVIVRGGWYF